MAGHEADAQRPDKENHYQEAALLHPVRAQILRLTCGDSELGARELAAELDEALGAIAYHLRVLVRRRALKVVPRCRPLPALYRRSPDAHWVADMLGEDDVSGSGDAPGGRD
jgi:DNA-binding transcriptional ArsR family regulator